MENPTKIQMDDLGVPLFLETAISKKQKKNGLQVRHLVF